MSTTTKFTPGPWKVFRASDGRSILGVGDKNAGGITDCGDVSTNDLGLWRSGTERDANAALIAAAPAMYDALESAIGAMEVLGHPKNYGALLKAQKVLAAARGEG